MPNTDRAQHVALDAQAVAVAAGELHHRLHPGLLEHDADRQAGDVHHGRLVVGDVVGVAVALERLDLALDGLDVRADRRRDLDAHGEVPGVEHLGQVAAGAGQAGWMGAAGARQEVSVRSLRRASFGQHASSA